MIDQHLRWMLRVTRAPVCLQRSRVPTFALPVVDDLEPRAFFAATTFGAAFTIEQSEASPSLASPPTSALSATVEVAKLAALRLHEHPLSPNEVLEPCACDHCGAELLGSKYPRFPRLSGPDCDFDLCERCHGTYGSRFAVHESSVVVEGAVDVVETGVVLCMEPSPDLT